MMAKPEKLQIVQGDEITVTELRRELFCAYVVTGMSAVDAHEAVGHARSTTNACRYCRHPTVQSRLRALREAIEKGILDQDEAVWGRGELAKFMQDNAIASAAQGDYAPSNRAIELLGRDRGMFGQGGQEQLPEHAGVDEEVDQAALAATWLEEMALKTGTDSIAELAQALRCQ